MGIGGPSATKANVALKGASPFHFLRVLRFARSQKRILWTAVFCVVFVALTYSLDIVALLPLVKVIAEKQSIPSWVHQFTAEKRLELNLGIQDGEILVNNLEKKSPLTGMVRKRDLLVGVDGQQGSPADILRRVAYAAPEEPIRLTFRSSLEAQPYEASVTAKPMSWVYRFALRIARVFPEDMTNRDAQMRTLLVILGAVFVVSLFGAVCRFFGEYLIALVAARIVVAMRRRMYDRVLKLPVSYFATNGTSDLVSRFVQDSQEVYRGLNFVFAKSLREPMKAAFVFIGALIIDWRITLIIVIGGPLSALIIRRIGKLIRKANRRLLQEYGRMLGALTGALNGIRVVKGYGMENYEKRHLHAVDKQMLRQQLKIEVADALSSPLFEMVGRIVATIAVMYFAGLMFDGTMSFSKFAALGACMAGIFDPVRKMSSFYNRMQASNAALDRVFEVLDMPDHEAEENNKPHLPTFSQSLEFQNVSFTYPGAETPALDRISLVVRKGEHVAFVGPNGSGKTTLLALLMRFFEPGQGRLLLDGHPVLDFSLHSLRNQMSLITQDTVIFADTIANNIAYGDERLLRRIVLRARHPDRKYVSEADEHRIIDAAKAAHADEFIREKPLGYNTFVGERGDQLSGGQKQRIAISRAILRNAPIFIFDEATSQVDAESEQKIHAAVERFLEGRTALIIAHRFSTILQADRIVVMDRGRIVDSGKHEELIRRCKLYQTLYGNQIIQDIDTTVGNPVEPREAEKGKDTIIAR